MGTVTVSPIRLNLFFHVFGWFGRGVKQIGCSGCGAQIHDVSMAAFLGVDIRIDLPKSADFCPW
jgi:hypothetical protein